MARLLELFAGIGGVSCACPEIEVAAAMDIDLRAQQVYRQNFSTRYSCRTIESLTAPQLREYGADIWWLSPPCQPFTARGLQRDWEDPRTAALRNLIDLLSAVRPQSLALENVPGFESSETCRRLLEVLADVGYAHRLLELCPTEMGWPNRRRRIYLLAVLEGESEVASWLPLPRYTVTWPDILSQANEPAESLVPFQLSEQVVEKYATSLSRVARGRDESTACFASSYGKTWLQSGSYLESGAEPYPQLRRFSPREVSLLLGYPPSFQIPQELSPRVLLKLLGNSLSLPAVRYVLAHLPTGVAFKPRLPWYPQNS